MEFWIVGSSIGMVKPVLAVAISVCLRRARAIRCDEWQIGNREPSPCTIVPVTVVLGAALMLDKLYVSGQLDRWLPDVVRLAQKPSQAWFRYQLLEDLTGLGPRILGVRTTGLSVWMSDEPTSCAPVLSVKTCAMDFTPASAALPGRAARSFA